jgi:hypothetical protein
VKPRPWWETHPKKYWTRVDWAEARRLGVVPPKVELDPTRRLLAEAAQSLPKVSWGQPASQADKNRREAQRLLEKHGLRPPRW